MSKRTRRKAAPFADADDSTPSATGVLELLSSSAEPAERPPKRKTTAPLKLKDSDSSKVFSKNCDKANCQSFVPICFAEATERCAKASASSSRWYHLSPGEHFCNECFDNYYRSHKDGYAEFFQWKRTWAANSRTETSLKAFMNDQILPYWVQCRDCRKWRTMPKGFMLTRQYAEVFKCSDTRVLSCSDAEDSRVEATKDAHWIDTLLLPPYLRSSPAAPYVTDYAPDGVGMSASEDRIVAGIGKVCHKYLQPFHDPHGSPAAATFRPDLMDKDETIEFPEFTYAQQMYLGLRNLVVALWNQRPSEWLTAEKCAPYVICRGLARIRCMLEVEHIIYFLTRKCIINTGLLPSPPPADLKHDCKGDIIVIGAGVAGLAAARQLHNLGVSVRVLEAKDRIGGRAQSVRLAHNVVASTGADMIAGAVNNPLALLCIQAGLEMQQQEPSHVFFKRNGSIVDRDMQRKMDLHFNFLLDSVTDCFKDESPPAADIKLSDRLMSMHRIFIEDTEESFSEEEMSLMRAFMYQLELDLGANLQQQSATHWDHQEIFAQYAGPAFYIAEGFEAIMKKLAEPLTIQLNCPVSKVELTDSGISVHTPSGVVACAKVIVTVPLHVLQDGRLTFEPPLPDRKRQAIDSLGSGLLEKVILQFPSNFWSGKVRDSSSFCDISAVEEKRLFSTFSDLSVPSTGAHVLASYAVGDEVALFREKDDTDIINAALATLKRLFGDNAVPPPIGHHVTRWTTDPFAGMSNSYVQIGRSPLAYDTIAEEVSENLHFAGEASIRSHPHTITGAYLSGTREANKIIASVHV